MLCSAPSACARGWRGPERASPTSPPRSGFRRRRRVRQGATRDRDSTLSRLLLDITFLIEADRAGSAVEDLIADDDEVAIAAITLAELLVGVNLADSRHRPKRQRFVDDVGEVIPIVDYDATVATTHAELLVAVRRQGRPRGAHDLIIAATAKATQREVVSADRSAYDDLPGIAVRSRRP